MCNPVTGIPQRSPPHLSTVGICHPQLAIPRQLARTMGLEASRRRSGLDQHRDHGADYILPDDPIRHIAIINSDHICVNIGMLFFAGGTLLIISARSHLVDPIHPHGGGVHAIQPDGHRRSAQAVKRHEFQVKIVRGGGLACSRGDSSVIVQTASRLS